MHRSINQCLFNPHTQNKSRRLTPVNRRDSFANKAILPTPLGKARELVAYPCDVAQCIVASS